MLSCKIKKERDGKCGDDRTGKSFQGFVSTLSYCAIHIHFGVRWFSKKKKKKRTKDDLYVSSGPAIRSINFPLFALQRRYSLLPPLYYVSKLIRVPINPQTKVILQILNINSEANNLNTLRQPALTKLHGHERMISVNAIYIIASLPLSTDVESSCYLFDIGEKRIVRQSG